MRHKHPMPDFVWFALNRNNRLAGPPPRVSLPMGMLSDFDAHYVLFGDDGMARYTAKTFLQAMRIRKETGLYLTRILDRKD